MGIKGEKEGGVFRNMYKDTWTKQKGVGGEKAGVEGRVGGEGCEVRMAGVEGSSGGKMQTIVQ